MCGYQELVPRSLASPPFESPASRSSFLRPHSLPLPSVLDAYFIFFYETCGDRWQVFDVYNIDVMVDIVDAFLAAGFKVSALLPSEDAKRGGAEFPPLS
jgi:hypothetical protein